MVCELFVKSEFLQVDVNDLFTFLMLWKAAEDCLVDATWPQQSHIYQVWSTRCRHNENTVSTLHAIKVAQELIHNPICYWSLPTSLGHKWVKLIEKEDWRLLILSSFKQLSHVLLTSTNVLVKQLRTLDTDEVNVEFLGDSGSHVCFATAGWSVQE